MTRSHHFLHIPTCSLCTLWIFLISFSYLFVIHRTDSKQLIFEHRSVLMGLCKATIGGISSYVHDSNLSLHIKNTIKITCQVSNSILYNICTSIFTFTYKYTFITKKTYFKACISICCCFTISFNLRTS